METARSRPSFHSSRIRTRSAPGGKLPEQTPLLLPTTSQAITETDSLDEKAPWYQRFWHWIRNNWMTASIILLLLGGLIALIVYEIVINGLSDGSDPKRKTEEVCMTPECVLASAELLKNLSPRWKDLDPCTQFDKFACEGFQETRDMRADQGSISTASLMDERASTLLRHLLESEWKDVKTFVVEAIGADESIFGKLRDSYAACLDEELIAEEGLKPLIKVMGVVDEIFKRERGSREGFPVLKTQQQLGGRGEEGLLSEVVTYLAGIGVVGLVDLGVDADDRDPDNVVPSISAPRSPGLPSKQYYEDEDLVEQYTAVIDRTFERIDGTLNNTSPIGTMSPEHRRHVVGNLVALERRLAKATPATEEAEDVTFYYNPASLAELATLLPQFSFEYFVQTFAPHAPKPQKVIVGAPKYLHTVTQLLKSTSKETLEGYFVWKIVQQYAYKVEHDALKPLKQFNNQLQGKDLDAKPERWRTCVQVADRSLGWILSRFFVQKSFSEEARIFGNGIVTDIKRQFIERLSEADWMSDEVKALGIEKVHAIVQKIGYPIASPDIRNATALELYYAPINISSTTYFANTLSVAHFDTLQEWSALGHPTDRNKWDMTADTVNAYYNPPGNEIVFPAGIMQAPVFYLPSVPIYLTYGAFGAVSGHELSHAFDSTGRHYDEKGNYTDWWDDRTVSAFKTKADCFVGQYEDFVVENPHGEDLHINGRLTLGENIADAGGVNAAFVAWKREEGGRAGGKGKGGWKEGRKLLGKSKLLPGLESWSREQLFFVSYANWWCGKTRPERAVELVYRDPHAPGWARILGTMANSRDFREAFNCPVKQPTCELW